MACSPNEDSDQSVRPRSLIYMSQRAIDGYQWPNVSSGKNLSSGQTARMHRLISSFAVRACQLVPYPGYRLNVFLVHHVHNKNLVLGQVINDLGLNGIRHFTAH